MMKFRDSIWVLICNFVLSLFRHFVEHLAGSGVGDDHEGEDQIVVKSLSFDGVHEEEKSEFTFGFKFQMKEGALCDFNGVDEAKLGGNGGSVVLENGLMSASKYQFISAKDFGGFVVAEPQSVNFTVHELFVEDASKKDDFIIKKVEKEGFKNKDQVQELDENSIQVDDFKETEVSAGEILQSFDRCDKNTINHEEKAENYVHVDSVCDENHESKVETQLNFDENGDSVPGQVNWLGEFLMTENSFCHMVRFSRENEPQLESDDSADGFFSISPPYINSASSPEEPECEINENSVQENPSPEEPDDDFIEFKPHFENSNPIPDTHLENFDDQQLNEQELTKSSEFQEKVRYWEFDLDEDDEDEDEDEADVLMEHQELIGQMKMELKNARTGGLPTILEECEVIRMKEDLKPLKINEKLERRDQMAEIQKFYKSYADKMRKLDVLNYQTLQAINFLRMKHPDQLNTGENSSFSALKSVFLPSFWPCKLRRIYADPTLKSITELQRDLEIVYVGQTCLSWEILYWQFKKVKELQQHDPQGYRSYNQIAVEFQQFRVLLQRFTEDETFQGPRVQNYAKQRCILRGLLQVPAIKDDNLKEKKARSKGKGDAISIAMLADTIKESMSAVWEFVRSDKDTTNLFLTVVLQGNKAYLQDPADSHLLMDVKTSHQKKDRRLKDMIRTGNCLVKKFQKHQETILDQHMFVSQVELRLVSRVLSLPRLSRDQLLWCQSKLNNINFIDRKIRVEETLFLLFPC